MTGRRLPFALLGAGAFINLASSRYSKVLFTDPSGKKMLYASIATLIVGGLMIRVIVNGIEVWHPMQIVFYFAAASTVFCTAALRAAPMLLKPAPTARPQFLFILEPFQKGGLTSWTQA